MTRRLAAVLLIFLMIFGCMSDGMCIYGDNTHSDKETKKPEIYLSCEGEQGKNGYYISMVKVSVDIREFDTELIKEKEYIIQKGNSIISKKFDGDTFDITENGENMTLYVRIKDYEGHIYTSSKMNISVHMAKPYLSIQRIGNDTVDIEVCEKYGDTSVAIKDIKSYLDIRLTAKDYRGEDIGYENPVIEWSEKEDNIYCARIRIVSDGIYSLSAVYDNGINDAIEESISFVADNEPPDEDMVKVSVYKYDADGHRCGKSVSSGFGNNSDKINYTNGYYEMEISGYDRCDLISGVDASGADGVCYYVTDKNLGKNGIEEIKDWEEYSDGYVIKIDSKRFRIYVKLTDRQGNASYVSTGEYIVDDEPPYISNIEVLSEANENGFYNKNVTVRFESYDRGKISSGTDKIEYRVKCNGRVPENWKTLKHNESGKYDVDIPAKDNNGEVCINVRVKDKAGNVSVKKSRKIKIDTISPSIYVEYDNNDVKSKSSDGRGYFNRKRIAKLTVTEENFNEDKALDYINIYIKKENDKEYRQVSSKELVQGRWQNKGNEHSIKLKFDPEAGYIFRPAYTDEAGNDNEDVIYGNAETPEKFIIDTTKPDALIFIKDKEWMFKGFKSSLRYNRYSAKSLETGIESYDGISGIKDVSYCIMSDSAKDIRSMKWKKYKGTFMINQRGNQVVYARVEDYAGNVRYVNTNGMIIDDMPPEINISAEDEREIYTSDVKLNVSVKENRQNNAFSGIKSVKYEVYSMGNITKQGVMYDRDTQENSIKDVYNGEIPVDSKTNNSNDVIVVIYAQDNAGNEAVMERHLKIDVTPPEVKIRYDNNDGIGTDGEKKYFKANRTARIEIKERNLDTSKVNIIVNGQDGNTSRISEWRKTDGTGNMDDNLYVTEMNFENDGDYTFNISCDDEAGNVSKTDYGDSVSPTCFTIDKSANPVKIVYDNNEVSNGLYYDRSRTAKIIIDEKNFDISKVNIDITITQGTITEKYEPAVYWMHDNDIHTAVVKLEDDGYYTVKAGYSDKAGNVADSEKTDNFYLDKTMPEVTTSGVGDKSANRESNIGLNVKITDSNLDSSNVKLTALIRKDEKYYITDIDFETVKTNSGIEYIYENLENDGIYTLECNAVDKAGNVYVNESTNSGKVLTFTVNRNGSVFYPSEYAVKLSERFYIRSVDSDIVISEINAAPLNYNIMKINGEILQKNTDYTVEKVDKDGEWNRYEYTIKKSLFKEDKEYIITMQSEDASGGVSYSDMKNMKLSFTVDTKEPEVSVSGIKENGIYNAKSKKVHVRVRDDGGMVKSFSAGISNSGKVLVNMDGEELSKYLEENDGIVTFNIPEVVGEKLYIKCSDYSSDEDGNCNVYEKQYRNITISQNRFILFYKNKPLFYGSIVVLVCLVFTGVYLAAVRIRKSKINKNS